MSPSLRHDCNSTLLSFVKTSDGGDIAGFPADEEPSDAVLNAVCVLDESPEVAMRACYGTTPRPWGAGMDVLPEPASRALNNSRGLFGLAVL